MTEPAYAVFPMRFSADPAPLIEFWRTLGLRQLDGASGGYAEFAAASGLLAVHPAEPAGSGASPGQTTLNVAVADVDVEADRLAAAGWPTRVRDEPYGRQGVVTGPAGRLIGLNAIPSRGGEVDGGQRIAASLDVVAVWYSDDFTADAAFFGAFGFEPFGSLDNPWWCDLRAARRRGGVIGLHGTGGGGPAAGGAGPALVQLGFETSEPLDALAARLVAAGYADARVTDGEAGIAVEVADPDGQRVEVHPTI
ncbi:VOC family protein [Microlunatus ginsengisoli]|uniref:VOC domain-containing protein n=1 Tax=Microlunatus ginsengisoli TaxID=363863 RepID=A0ABP7A728_9ACTN